MLEAHDFSRGSSHYIHYINEPTVVLRSCTRRLKEEAYLFAIGFLIPDHKLSNKIKQYGIDADKLALCFGVTTNQMNARLSLALIDEYTPIIMEEIDLRLSDINHCPPITEGETFYKNQVETLKKQLQTAEEKLNKISKIMKGE